MRNAPKLGSEEYTIFRKVRGELDDILVNDLIKVASNITLCPISTIKSRQKQYEVSLARHLIMDWLHRHGRYSTVRVAKMVGNACVSVPYCHSVVLYAIRRFEDIVDGFEQEAWENFEIQAIKMLFAPDELDYQI